MKLRALLIDDDYTARQELCQLLRSFEDVQVVGEAGNASEALALTNHLDASLIFLDPAMPGLEGSDLTHLQQDKGSSPIIILTAAYEEYAFAFAVNALDYFVKPINPERLAEALEKVRQWKGALAQDKPLPLHSKQPEVIPVEQKGKIIILHQEDIIFVYTDKDNVYIKTQTDSYLTRFTLRELEVRLNPDLFFRSHRCYLVNTQRMKELIPYLNGTYTIIMDDDEQSQIPMSRTKSRVLKEMLGL